MSEKEKHYLRIAEIGVAIIVATIMVFTLGLCIGTNTAKQEAKIKYMHMVGEDEQKIADMEYKKEEENNKRIDIICYRALDRKE
jgi:hypothetical protein